MVPVDQIAPIRERLNRHAIRYWVDRAGCPGAVPPRELEARPGRDRRHGSQCDLEGNLVAPPFSPSRPADSSLSHFSPTPSMMVPEITEPDLATRREPDLLQLA